MSCTEALQRHCGGRKIEIVQQLSGYHRVFPKRHLVIPQIQKFALDIGVTASGVHAALKSEFVRKCKHALKVGADSKSNLIKGSCSVIPKRHHFVQGALRSHEHGIGISCTMRRYDRICFLHKSDLFDKRYVFKRHLAHFKVDALISKEQRDDSFGLDQLALIGFPVHNKYFNRTQSLISRLRHQLPCDKCCVVPCELVLLKEKVRGL
mmetsp:Transcript_7818/g.13822  ORF Transcript_7818/g.13822 Transcript_7818/m.13822 type:complete len:208 (-) Transcript_7818:1275-1898(-)